MAWLSSYLAHGTTLKYVPEQDQEVAAKVVQGIHEASRAIPNASGMKTMKKTMKKTLKKTMKAKN